MSLKRQIIWNCSPLLRKFTASKPHSTASPIRIYNHITVLALRSPKTTINFKSTKHLREGLASKIHRQYNDNVGVHYPRAAIVFTLESTKRVRENRAGLETRLYTLHKGMKTLTACLLESRLCCWLWAKCMGRVDRLRCSIVSTVASARALAARGSNGDGAARGFREQVAWGGRGARAAARAGGARGRGRGSGYHRSGGEGAAAQEA